MTSPIKWDDSEKTIFKDFITSKIKKICSTYKIDVFQRVKVSWRYITKVQKKEHSYEIWLKSSKQFQRFLKIFNENAWFSMNQNFLKGWYQGSYMEFLSEKLEFSKQFQRRLFKDFIIYRIVKISPSNITNVFQGIKLSWRNLIRDSSKEHSCDI